jgi:hypothetical protein
MTSDLPKEVAVGNTCPDLNLSLKTLLTLSNFPMILMLMTMEKYYQSEEYLWGA